jgi:predicted nucleotidyltransferase
MKSDISEIIDWLRSRVALDLGEYATTVLLFGSLAKGSDSPRDCDVLVLYDVTFVQQICEKSVYIKTDFEELFELRLHLTRISSRETRDLQALIDRILSRPHIRLLNKFST